MVASGNGDSVLVRPGTYFEAVSFPGKNVVLRSLAGPATTIIDATGRNSSAVLMDNVGTGASLEGFTVRKGTGTTYGAYLFAGGGVHVREGVGDGPRVEDNWITQNAARYGGGIFTAGGARLNRNRIFANEALFDGGGVLTSCNQGFTNNVIISENEVFGNRSTLDFAGGGLSICGFCHSVITRNVIACNEAADGGGGYICGSDLGVVLEGNTVFANWGREGIGGIHFSVAPFNPAVEVGKNAIVYNFGGGIYCGSSPVAFECNDVHGNNPDYSPGDCGEPIGTNGNLSVDPMFGAVAGCPPAPGDLCLATGSPLLPENSPPGCGLIGARGLCSQIGIADETPAPESERNRISAQPNPFATRTTLVIDLVTPDEIDLRITNALGRVVTEQSLGTLRAGRHRWTWDGRDGSGRQSSAGVYYAEVQAGGRSLVTRLMILR